MLQYRRVDVNITLIDGVTNDDSTSDSSNASLDQQLRMVEVAYIRGNGIDLEFIKVNVSIWPSECMHSFKFISICGDSQATFVF